MKLPSYLKRSIYSGFTFFLTVLILSIGYGALNGGLSLSDKVGTGSGLSANSWNRIIDGMLDLDTRVSNFSFSGGNVGIGGNASSQRRLIVNAALNNGASGLLIDGKTRQGTETNIPLLQIDSGLANANATAFWVNTSGKVGIGTTNPVVNLDVNGEIKAGNTGLACSASTAGSMRYNSNNMEYCNGATWTAMNGFGKLSQCRVRFIYACVGCAVVNTTSYSPYSSGGNEQCTPVAQGNSSFQGQVCIQCN